MRVLRKTWCVAGLVIGLCGFVDAALPEGRTLSSLDPGWRFLPADDAHGQEPGLDDRSWQPVDLPHTWNAIDGENGGGYRRGPGWYRRHLTPDASLAGRRLYLQFDGASLVADVYVNGQHLGTHKGGFARFRFDATGVLRPGQDNLIAVRVDNSVPPFPPTSADFTFFGGLYRDVSLLSTDPVQVSVMDHGSPGVFLEQQSVAADLARVLVRAEIENHGVAPHDVEVSVTLRDAAGATVGEVHPFRTRLEAGASREVLKPLEIKHPHLWNARADPYLYSVRVELRPVAPAGSPGAVSDAVEQPLGLRFYTVDPDRGFLLNGRYLDLHGFNRHQDWPDQGWAITDAEEAVDFGLMREIGATAVRVSHYQQSQSWYSRCDQSGIVAWAEIPFVSKALPGPEFLDNAKEQLRELIRQNFNHPSICFWGVGNETSGDAADGVVSALARVVKDEDPTRLSTYASHHDNADPRNRYTDVVAFNRYFGWYQGDVADFRTWLDRTHSDYPAMRFGMSEFGAGASIIQHAENPPRPEPKGPFHPEEYQSLYHEAYWAALRSRPFVWCKFIWCLHDFASDFRHEGDHPGRNDKGLVTYDRKVRKDAFYYYKAQWVEEPVLHLNSTRFEPRRQAVTEVKVYSNAAEVELLLNGRSLGRVRDPDATRVFAWPAVRLSPGQNKVVARARFGASEIEDGCLWTLVAE